MRVTIPVQITDAMLTSSSVSEPAAGEVVYVPATTYAKDAQVISTTAHKVYQSLQAGNVGNPLPVLPETSTAWWIEVGATQKWAMFDLERSTQTVGTSVLNVTLTPGARCNTVGILGMDADTVRVTATSGGATVYDSGVQNLIIRDVLDQYMYAYEPFSRQESFVTFALPPYSDIVINASFTRSTGVVKCGSFVIGTYNYIGNTQYEAESDALNFSSINRDIYGTASLIKRRSVPKTNQTLELDKSKVARVYKLRDQLNAVPALWTAVDDGASPFFEVLLILGIYKQFKINVSNPSFAKITLELEEI